MIFDSCGNKSEEEVDYQSDYQSDKALVSLNQDEFKHSHFVTVLKDILTKSKPPLNIGLYGRWGVGKSSILHMLKESLEKEQHLSDKFRYVEVDAWGFSAKSLQQDILSNLNNHLKTFTRNELEDLLFNVRIEEGVNFIERFKKYWHVLVGGVVVIGGIFLIPETSVPALDMVAKFATASIVTVLGTVIAFIRFMAGSSKRIISRPISPFQFDEIYEKMVKQQDKTLVVVIDNIDRCDDKVAVDLLGVIQTFMTKPRCINILACDNEAIVNHLRSVKGPSYTDREGNEFLSKFFQVTIRIPPFIGENLDSYAQRLMAQRSIEFDPFVKQILISGAIKNPRKINQFLNNVVALYRLAELKENDNKITKEVVTKRTDVLTKIIVLQHEWPEFYKALEKESRILNDSKIYNKWQQDQADLQNNKKSMHVNLSELDDFLNATQFCSVEDISPFLRLNQESYQADIPEIDKFELDVNSNKLKVVLKTIKELKDDKKEQYIKKINSLADKHAREDVVPSLMNCTLVQIGVLDEITDTAQRKILLANLGRHMSSTLLDQLEKYEYKKIFPILAEMEEVFHNVVFAKLLELGVKENELNLKIWELFINYSNSIPQKILEKADISMATRFTKNETNIMSLFKDKWSSPEWISNNFPKPTLVLRYFHESIKLDGSSDDDAKLAISEKIYNTISPGEKKNYLTRIAKIVSESENTQQKILPPKFFEISDSLISKLEDGEIASQFTNALLRSIQSNPDLEQKKQSFEIIFQVIKEKDVMSTETTQSFMKLLSEFLRVGGHAILKWFMDKNSEYETELLKHKMIMDGFWESFLNNGPNDEEIIQYLATKTPEEQRDRITELFLNLILSKDKNQYLTLLSTLAKNKDTWPETLIEKLQSSFPVILSKIPYPDNVELSENLVECYGKYDGTELEAIASEVLPLTQSESPEVAERCYGVINKINSKLNRLGNQIGVNESIRKFQDHIEANDANLLQPHYSFLLTNIEKLALDQKINMIDILKKQLKSEVPHDVMLLVLNLAQKLDKYARKDLGDEIIDLAEKSSEEDVKNMCKEIIISLKGNLYYSQKEKAEEIFGKGIFE